MSTHIAAKQGEIAEIVLLPGDPLRAKWVAETFLEDATLYSSVRNMFGFTGMYQGHRVSVQGTGMGAPSIGIYAHELFNDYGVQKAIRIGTSGGLPPTKLRDVVIAMAASTDSNINRRATNGLDFAPAANYELLEKAVNHARTMGIDFHVGTVASGDLFYDGTDSLEQWKKLGILALEMETSQLFTLAARFGRKALSILTVSDLMDGSGVTSAQERETGFSSMVEIALAAAL
ncbi:purine-nucleoside phosphorylase [Aquiluna borgnonia]|uniref:Uridine phosphorylase n=1 Tax=Aquiluna borgnonia TaxID=2499157 RepID=A0A7D4TU05_9MICO|nr:purine-nucleoside phosphorylase [Aquiluna borgnonia]QKJ25115.1 purine-nucleoside phosphorylase [Aquiluna borgnonia]